MYTCIFTVYYLYYTIIKISNSSKEIANLGDGVSRSPSSRRTAHWVPTAPMSWYLGEGVGGKDGKDGKLVGGYVYMYTQIYIYKYTYMFDVWKYQNDNNQGRWKTILTKVREKSLLFIYFSPPFHLTHEKSNNICFVVF